MFQSFMRPTLGRRYKQVKEMCAIAEASPTWIAMIS